MQVTNICKDNVYLIMYADKKVKKRDIEFLDSLWEYVLFSKNVSRILPFCKICHEHGKFIFEGKGGIKKVGDGLMYIPIDNEQLYVIPDIMFHYFYVHKLMPTKIFRDAVMYEAKPKSEQYIRKVKPYYEPEITHMKGNKVCSCCGKVFDGTLGFRKGNEGSVTVFRQNFFDKVFMKDRKEEKDLYMICYNCLHHVKV